MVHSYSWLGVGIGLVATLIGADGHRTIRADGIGQSRADKPLTCVHTRGESRADGIGYKHVVIVDNRCKVDANCQVSTDVQPAPISVRVAAGATAEVVTFLSAPGSGFTPSVTCWPAS